VLFAKDILYHLCGDSLNQHFFWKLSQKEILAFENLLGACILNKAIPANPKRSSIELGRFITFPIMSSSIAFSFG
jgi:hypothetical protein